MTDEAKRITEALHNGAEYNYCNFCMVGELDDCNDKTSCVLLKAVDLIEELSASRDLIESECNAAMEDIYLISFEHMCCTICSHHGESLNKELCKSCGLGYLNNNFSWRGLRMNHERP